MHAAPPLLEELAEYEKRLAHMQRAYRGLRDARTRVQREAARAEHERALARAREAGARLAVTMRAAADARR